MPFYFEASIVFRNLLYNFQFEKVELCIVCHREQTNMSCKLWNNFLYHITNILKAEWLVIIESSASTSLVLLLLPVIHLNFKMLPPFFLFFHAVSPIFEPSIVVSNKTSFIFSLTAITFIFSFELYLVLLFFHFNFWKIFWHS